MEALIIDKVNKHIMFKKIKSSYPEGDNYPERVYDLDGQKYKDDVCDIMLLNNSTFKDRLAFLSGRKTK